jgi:hypothetical protein
MMFAVCTAFADRLTEKVYAVPWLQAFGIIGMLIMMTVLQLAIR